MANPISPVRVLETGCPVILEKPIAVTIAEAAHNSMRIVAAADEISRTGQTINL